MKRQFVLTFMVLAAATAGITPLWVSSTVDAQEKNATAKNIRLNSQPDTSGTVTISPTTLNFGFIQVGMSTAGQNVTVMNNGTTTLTVGIVTVSANYVKTNNCTAPVNPGASCTIKVNFIPKLGGKLNGTLTINDSDPSSPQTVSLTGVALAVGMLGGPLAGLISEQNTVFESGFTTFNTKWDPFKGLGPVYTQAGCFTCHGGGVPFPTGVPGNTSTNMGTRFGKFNPDLSFNPLDGSGAFPENEGGPILHPQTVAGIPRIQHCSVTGEVVPGDATIVNMIRSPQVFGLGLIDSIQEAAILANLGTKGTQNEIKGVANMVPDQNGQIHVGRFGQKASIPNLLFFTLSAMFNELGITSPVFPNEHIPSGDQVISPGCETDPNDPQDVNGANSVSMYQFQAMLAPAPTTTLSGAAQAGKVVFENIGCNLCHVESMQTDPNATILTDLNGRNMGTVAALANQTASLYSDLLLHDMGPGLIGGIPLGQASLTQWRTAPLWGLSTRLPFGLLHDARAKDVDSAIRAHGGEASIVVGQYMVLSPKDQSNLFSFLGSI